MWLTSITEPTQSGVRAEAGPPQALTQHDYGIRGVTISGLEQPPGQRPLDSVDAEEVARDEQNPRRCIVARADRHGIAVIGDERAERARAVPEGRILFDRGVSRRTGPRAVGGGGGEDPDERGGVRVDPRPEGDGVEEREDSAADADAERQRRNDDHRQRRMTPAVAQRESDVLPDIIDQAQPAGVAAALLPGRGIAELKPRLARRIARREAPPHEIRGAGLEMEAQFFIHAVLERRTMAKSAPQGPRAGPHVSASRACARARRAADSARSSAPVRRSDRSSAAPLRRSIGRRWPAPRRRGP